jgi:hypothetical protein
MAVHPNYIKLTIESIKENLFIVDYCLNFDKAKNENWNGESKVGCLGIPALILICTLIDTIGSYFRGAAYNISIDGENHKIEFASDHFFILNHDKFFKLGLKMVTIMDFYSTYRSKLIHNMTLPENNFLEIGKKEDNIFQLDRNNKIIKINILPLFEKTKVAIDDFIYYLDNGTFSADHTVKKELIAKSKEYDPLNVPIITTAATGFTNTKI